MLSKVKRHATLNTWKSDKNIAERSLNKFFQKVFFFWNLMFPFFVYTDKQSSLKIGVILLFCSSVSWNTKV